MWTTLLLLVVVLVVIVDLGAEVELEDLEQELIYWYLLVNNKSRLSASGTGTFVW